MTSPDDVSALVGRRFPGGSYTVARWENVLLHDVVEADPAPGGLVHPIGLFHIPLAACGWTYDEIFRLCHAESAEAVRAGEYDWQIVEPLREGTPTTWAASSPTSNARPAGGAACSTR